MTTDVPVRTKSSRTLHADELALWRLVARDIKPLKKSPNSPQTQQNKQIGTQRAVFPAPIAPTMPLRANPSPATPKKARQSQSIELTRKQMNRLSRVNVAELLTLDLHGMTQEEAHRKLNVFIRDAYNTNVRLILLITGKGSRAERTTYGNVSYGVLKRVVPHWLESPSIRPWIIGYEEAAIGHGGGGALYIRLRQRSRSIDSDKSR